MDAELDPPDAHELLADVRWLGDLARQLVSDSALADDAVQEAWITAKRRLVARGEDRRPDRGLLWRTLNGALLHARRAAGRRRFHEGRAAQLRSATSVLPSTQELLVIGEQRQELWRHLSRLDEPYRTTLLLRFQQGIDTAALAQRLSIQEDSVRWRIRRGLELLRDSLQGEDRGQGLMGIVPMAALATPPLEAASTHSTLATLARVSLMKQKVLIAAAAAAFALVGTLWLSNGAPPDGAKTAPLSAADTGPRPASVALTQTNKDAVASTDRRPVENMAEGVTPPAVQVLTSVVAGRLVDPAGEPIAGGRIVMSRKGVWEHEGTSGRDGRFEVSCPSSAQFTVLLEVPAFGMHRGTFARFGTTTKCSFPPLALPRVTVGDLLLRDSGSVTGRLVDEVGQPIAGVPIRPQSDFLQAVSGDDGVFAFSGLRLGEVNLTADGSEYQQKTVSVDLGAGTTVDLGDWVLERRPLITVRGYVLDPAGRPIPSALVRTETADVVAGSNGFYELRTRTSGRDTGTNRARVHAEADGYRESLTLFCEDQSESTLVLHPLGRRAVLCALDHDTQEPIQGAEVWISERSDANLSGTMFRYGSSPATGERRAGADGQLELRGLVDVDVLSIRAPGYFEREIAFPGDVPEEAPFPVALKRKPHGIVRGAVPPAFRGDPTVRVELQDLQRLQANFAPDGSITAVAWTPPPIDVRRAGSSPALLEWLEEEPTLRTTGSHLMHVEPSGSFRYSGATGTLQRALVTSQAGRIAISDVYWVGAKDDVHVDGWKITSVGGLAGTVSLPHPDLAEGLELGLAGTRPDSFPVDTQGHFAVAGLTPGSYLLMPRALPDGLPEALFRRIVEILPAQITQIEIDPQIPPFGSVEFTLTINGSAPSHGFCVYLFHGEDYFMDYTEEAPGKVLRMLVPAQEGYRVAIEAMVPGRDNSGCELSQTLDVAAGDQSVHLSIETARVVCTLGLQLHPKLNRTWQRLLWQDANGVERTPIDAAVHVNGAVRPSLDPGTIEVEFLHVPVGAQALRFEILGRDRQASTILPFSATLRAGESTSVELE